MATRQTNDRPDLAADTVIGFVLVTGMSLAMITVVLLMGGPALEDVQHRQQTDAMVGSYHRLDRAVTTLLSGAPAGTAPAWQVSMARGSLSVAGGDGYIWGYQVDHKRPSGEYAFWFGNYADGDDELEIKNVGKGLGTDQFRIHAHLYDGDQETNDKLMPRSKLLGDPNSPSTNTTTLPWTLEGHTTQLELMNASSDELVAEAWFVDGGAVQWSQSGSQMTSVYYVNTAIVADIDSGQVMHNAPNVPPPEEKPSDDEDVFIRVVKLDGSVALGGRQTAELVLSSGGSHERHSHHDVQRVKVYPSTRTMEAWERRLTDDDRDYTFTPEDSIGVMVGDETAFFRDVDTHGISGQLSATLVETDITLKQGAGGG